MLKTRIIPCLDVADGRTVKGVNFVDLIDAGDPVEQAIAYNAAGADELVFLDIKATVENRGTMFDLAQTAKGGVVQLVGQQCYPWRVRDDDPVRFADHICVQFDAKKRRGRWQSHRPV